MDKLWKKLGLPLCIIIVGTLLTKLIGSLTLGWKGTLLEIVYLACLFSFGMSLNTYKKKRSSAWVGKLIICFLLTCFFLHRLGYFNLNALIPVIGMLGITHQTIAIPLIYILCGFLFFD